MTASTETLWTTAEREQLRKTVRTFAERNILPYVDDWERAGELPRDLHLRAADAGLLGADLPEDVRGGGGGGGGGGNSVDTLVICEELHEAGVPGGVFASLFTCGIAVPHMAASGDARLIERFVKPTPAGAKIGALAITEPGGESDVGHLRTTPYWSSRRARRASRSPASSTSWGGARRIPPSCPIPTSACPSPT